MNSISQHLTEARTLRASTLFYSPALDFNALKREAEVAMAGEKLDLMDSSSSPQSWQTLKRQLAGRPGCVLVRVDAQPSPALVRGVIELIESRERAENKCCVWLAAAVGSPSALDERLTSKFGIHFEVN